jgi:PadR family transcriptional regulator PadR
MARRWCPVACDNTSRTPRSVTPLDSLVIQWHCPLRGSLECLAKSSSLQGALDLILLRALEAMGPQHAYSLAARLEQVSKSRLTLKQGTLYPALVRLEQNGWITGSWRRTENNREAKYYSITKAGTRALTKETERWRRLSGFVDALLLNEP